MVGKGQTSPVLPNTCEDGRVLPSVDARVAPKHDEVVLLGMVEGSEPCRSGINQSGYLIGMYSAALEYRGSRNRARLHPGSDRACRLCIEDGGGKVKPEG